jgi:hypothetical protein
MKGDMNTNFPAIAAQLSDDALRAKVKVLAQRSHEVTVELIAHLAESNCASSTAPKARVHSSGIAPRSSGFPRRPLATESRLRGPLGSFL